MRRPSDTSGLSVRPAFFIHVMKTGGTTLIAHLYATHQREEIYPDPTLDGGQDPGAALALRPFTIGHVRRLSDERRRQIRIYVGHFPFVVCEVLGGGFDTVTLLRDPIDRTVSLLRQLQRGPLVGPPDEAHALGALSLEEVYEQPEVFERLVHNHQTKIFSMTLDDEPQGYLQLIDVDASRLAVAKANLATIDVVGLTERYDDFLGAVAERFGWRVKRDAHLNASPSDDGPPVSAWLRRRIAEDNAIDVELYEHARDLVAAR